MLTEQPERDNCPEPALRAQTRFKLWFDPRPPFSIKKNCLHEKESENVRLRCTCWSVTPLSSGSETVTLTSPSFSVVNTRSKEPGASSSPSGGKETVKTCPLLSGTSAILPTVDKVQQRLEMKVSRRASLSFSIFGHREQLLRWNHICNQLGFFSGKCNPSMPQGQHFRHV